MLTVLASKGLVLGVLFVMTFFLGLIPVKLMNYFQSHAALSQVEDSTRTRRGRLATYKRVLSFLSCYAGGVFLATCFLDLLPSVRKKIITVLFHMNIITGFPVSEFIMSLGLFFILIVEQIVLMVKEGHAHTEHDTRKPLLGKEKVNTSRSVSRDQINHEDFENSDHQITGISDQPDLSDDDIDEEDISAVPTNRNRSYSDHHNHHHHGHQHNDEMNFQTHSPLRAMLLLMALSLHSIFEGLAVGLQASAGQVLGIFAALVIHKSILSFSIGMNLVQSRLSIIVCVRSILFFSLTAPVGVAVGMIITNLLWNSNASSLADGVLQGVACGTFLYISFFEVLPAEFNSSHDRMLKLLMLLLGYGTVTAVLFLSDDVNAPFCKLDVGN